MKSCLSAITAGSSFSALEPNLDEAHWDCRHTLARGCQPSCFRLPLPGVQPRLPVAAWLSLGALPSRAKALVLVKWLLPGVPAHPQALGGGSAPAQEGECHPCFGCCPRSTQPLQGNHKPPYEATPCGGYSQPGASLSPHAQCSRRSIAPRTGAGTDASGEAWLH